MKFLSFLRSFYFNDRAIMAVSFFMLFVAFSAVSIARHFALSSGSQDLGIFDQAIWYMNHGKLLFSSLKGNMSLLGDHFEPILVILAPLYLLWNSPLVLLITQAALLASSVIPLFLISKQVLKERVLVISFTIAFILSRPLRGVAYSDFHPECFIVPLLFWAYYFWSNKKNLIFWLFMVLLLFCKEDACIYAIGFGSLALFKEKRYGKAFLLCVIGVAAWFFETRFFIPLFNPRGVYPYMDRLPFGASYLDNMKIVLTEPLRVISLFGSKEKVLYCLKMLGPLGFLSLLSPAHFLPLGLLFLRNLLPQNPAFSGYYNITSHYTAGFIPFIFISAISGASFIVGKIKGRRVAIYLSLFIFVASCAFFGKTDASKFGKFWRTINNRRTLEKISFLKMIPQDASVAANFNLVPHLSHRKFIFEWHPDAKTSAICEYIVLDKEMLEYIRPEDMAKVDAFLKGALKKGYVVDFESKNGMFVILHNTNIDKSLVKAVF